MNSGMSPKLFQEDVPSCILSLDLMLASIARGDFGSKTEDRTSALGLESEADDPPLEYKL